MRTRSQTSAATFHVLSKVIDFSGPLCPLHTHTHTHTHTHGNIHTHTRTHTRTTHMRNTQQTKKHTPHLTSLTCTCLIKRAQTYALSEHSFMSLPFPTCRMMMSFMRIISTAAKCSDVWGWGQLSLAATSSSAPSMTAAPLSMVAMRISWPGQSTKETWRVRFMGVRQISQGGWSSFTLL